MGDGDAVTFHGVAPHSGGVEEKIHQVVVEQIDLIHIQNPPVRGGQQAWLEGCLSLAQRRLEIQRPGDTVLGGADR